MFPLVTPSDIIYLLMFLNFSLVSSISLKLVIVAILALSSPLFSLLSIENHGCGKICQPSEKHGCESPVPLGLVHGPSEQQVPSRWASYRCISRRVYTWHSSAEEERPSSPTILWQCQSHGYPSPLQIPTTELTSDPGHHPGKPTARLERGHLHLQVTPVILWVKIICLKGFLLNLCNVWISPPFSHFLLPSGVVPCICEASALPLNCIPNSREQFNVSQALPAP